MKLILGGLAASLAAMPACGQTGGGTIPQAEQLIRQVAQAYKAAPAFEDEVSVTYRSARGGSASDALTIAFGPNATARITMEGFIVMSVNGWFYLQRESLPGKYYARPLAGNVVETFREISDGGTLPVPQGVLRYSDASEAWMKAFGLARLQNLKPLGLTVAQRDGHKVHQIQFTGDNGGTATAIIDPDTRFILELEVNDMLTVSTMTMHPRSVPALSKPITFDPSGKRQVTSLPGLSLGEGDPAPDFTLESLDGDQVTLSDKRGSVVVLEFWATWCGPCRWGLPRLQQLADWADESGHPVSVFAVNIGERHPTREAIYRAVSSFWQSQGFTMPTLMDYDNSVAGAFEVGPIPHTVVIDPQGKVASMHAGLDPNMVENLRRETIELLE